MIDVKAGVPKETMVGRQEATMTTHALPRWSDGMLRELGGRPRPLVLAALAFVLVGAVVLAAPDPAGVVLGGTSGWILWFAGMTVLAFWLLLLLGGQPLKGLLVAGSVAAASGAFLFYNPRTGAAAVGILLISTLVLDGGLQLALALKLRPAGVWRWLFAPALASGIAAMLMSGGMLSGSAAALGPLVGAAMISSGLALALLGGKDLSQAAGRSR
ncbi:hypothetical protein [Brevundimonas sp.]|uniref:hypothetical protein n=1 Tax=Brevundimonas sp. TaxID=1871086 RepID=UPI002D52638B|nr:hypothetical protein [Brevundimonas sp.]HYD27701.1 hypothetical protein [Brevundimonas sp.]